MPSIPVRDRRVPAGTPDRRPLHQRPRRGAEWRTCLVRVGRRAERDVQPRLAQEDGPARERFRASLLLAREVGEPEAWVAVRGVVLITEEGVVPLMERLAARYWLDEDPAVARAHAKTVKLWRKAAAQLRVLTIEPDEIRSYGS